VKGQVLTIQLLVFKALKMSWASRPLKSTGTGLHSKAAFSFYAPHLWNRLLQVRADKTVSLFKSGLKALIPTPFKEIGYG